VPDTSPTQHGQGGPAPLGWPPFIVTAVHTNYIEAKPYDGTSAYGNAQDIAKSPEQRSTSYGAVDDIILAAPVLTIVRNDADSADVICQWVQVSGNLPAGTGQYKVLQLDASDLPVWDWVRAHD